MVDILSRRSIRKYRTDVKITKDEMLKIISEAQRAPSSQNMQPIRYHIIESDEAKETLRPFLHGNKSQLDTSSAMILMVADLKKFELAEKIYQKAVDEGIMPLEVKNRQLAHFNENDPYSDMTKHIRNAYIDGGLAAMQLMLAAKKYGYDTCAIGGFNRDGINEAFNISSRYLPVLIVSIGAADEPGYKSTRLDTSDVVSFL